MSTDTATTTTTKSARAANLAGRAIIDAVQTAGDHTLPQVVETAEVAMAFDVPTKVVLNQRLVVAATAVSAAAVGAGLLWGAQKLRTRLHERKIAKQLDEGVVLETA